jgi:hypothetical protein
MRLVGTPLRLDAYQAESITNPQFQGLPLKGLDAVFLPASLARLMDGPSQGTREFIEDDNRGAILPDPVATLDGLEFFLSVKGVGSAVEPFSTDRLDGRSAAPLVDDPALRERLGRSTSDDDGPLITGELWLRGSPYGGQGLPHATTALRVSERADLTSIGGFLIAPVVKICLLPMALEEQLRQVYWYRRFRGRFVQELRLVPSNVRIYFHSRSTVGNNPRHVFDLFRVDSNARALQFELHFVRSVVAMLTLFARTLTFDPARGRYLGLDFHDVWLDKDAVIAPSGSAYFVDLEGIEDAAVEKEGVSEKIEDQVYRSLYEFMFAYEQIERERCRRFGEPASRREHFEAIVREALKDDPIARPVPNGRSLELCIRNRLSEESLNTNFPLVDR